MSSSNNLEFSWKEIITEASLTAAGLPGIGTMQKKWNISRTAATQTIKMMISLPLISLDL